MVSRLTTSLFLALGLVAGCTVVEPTAIDGGSAGGQPCPSGNISSATFAGAPSSGLNHYHMPGAVGGYCHDLAAGIYTVQVHIENWPGRPAQCWTGAPSTRWLLEAQEVQ